MIPPADPAPPPPPPPPPPLPSGDADGPGPAPPLTPAPQALRAFAKESEPRLRELLDQKMARARELPVDLWPAFAALRDTVLRGGKRLRGALCLLGFQAARGAPREDALPAAVALELFHAYLLVHDDVMDRDELRRGGPTLHVALARNGALFARDLPVPAGEHAGQGLAILFGSLLQAWSLELLLASPVAPDRLLRATQLLASALERVTLGQALDLAAPLGPEPTIEQVLEIEALKTGSYTFELPLLLGAHLAGGSDKLLAALSSYALPMGKAFQIVDDLLGVFGSPQTTGKPAGNDLREGKRTLLILRALELLPPADAALLRSQLGRRDLTQKELDDLRGLLQRCGAEQWARVLAGKLCDRAIAGLASQEIPRPVAGQLEELARYTVERVS